MSQISIPTIILLLILVGIQGTLIFRDAMKSNIPYPWIWGIIGLMNIPSSTIIYLVFKKLYFKKKKRR